MANEEHLAILRKGVEEWNRWRKENPDEAPDLSGADLSGVSLSRADLSNVNLCGADLSRARLHGATLRGAFLRGADLRRAELSSADLIGANLNEANLIGANLSEANLTGANFLRAHVELGDVLRGELSLSAIRTLPSTIGRLLLGHNDQAHITRSIEFPPQYKAAGLAILNHFEDVVRSRYSDIDVRVTITQEGNAVTMIIETEDGGQLEKVRKTLEEYGLVIRGEMAPDELLTDPLAVLDLRNQLRLAQVQLETKKEMLAVVGDMNRELRRLLSEAITRPPAVTPDVYVTTGPVSPVVNVTVAQSQKAVQHQHVEISQSLETLRASLADLAQQLPQEDPAAAELADAAKELEDAARDPESAKTSPVPERVRRFFEALGDEKSRLGKTVKGVKRGAEIAQDLARRYNDVAQWMGWPQVPKPFLGKGSKKERTKE